MHPSSDRLFTPGMLRTAYNLLSARIFATLLREGPSDLRPSHGNVMEHLSYQDGLRLTDLAVLAGITAQSMGELVDDLEQKGYVERRPDPADRRAKRLFLTAKGQANVRSAERAAIETEEYLERLLGEDRHRDLRRLLTEIIAIQDSDST